jgi:CarboxypepD_reg-like domain
MKRKFLVFYIIFLILATNNKIFGQTINGKVLDAKTLNTAPYSTLEIKGKGIGWVSDSIGHFTIEIPRDKTSENDTLLIRSLGFTPTEVILKNILKESSLEIKLKPSFFQLDTIVVKPKNTSLVKGVTTASSRVSSASREWGQEALYIENEEEIKAIIQNVSFFILATGKPKAPFRIRFYDKLEDGSPGKDLIQENIIVTPQQGNTWFKIDVSKYKILVPKEGYFVAMEWIFTAKKYYYDIPVLGKKTIVYGQCLGKISDEKIIPNSWTYSLGDKWRKIDEPFKRQGKIVFFNVMINSEIKPIE